MNAVFSGSQRSVASGLNASGQLLSAALSPRWLRLLVLASFVMLANLLLTPFASAGTPAPPGVPSSQRLADVEHQLAQARKRLDEAALELARLHEAVEVSAGKKGGGGRAMLGVLIDEPKRREGVFIAGVTPGGGAAAAGLRSGDVIVAIDGQVMDGSQGHPHSHISKIMNEVTPGSTVAVRYQRNGSEQQTKVVTQASGFYAASLPGLKHGDGHKKNIEIEMGCFEPKALLQELSDSLGVDFDSAIETGAGRAVLEMHSNTPYLVDLSTELARYFDTDSGVLVVVPPPNTGLQAGDVLEQIAGKPVANMQDMLAMLQRSDAGKPIKLQVVRQGKTQQVSIIPGLLDAPDSRVIRISGDDGELRIELSRTPTGRTNLAP